MAVTYRNPQYFPLTLDKVRDTILHLLPRGSEGHYRIGQLYNYIVDNRLAVKAGYRNVRAYFRRHVRVLSHASLTMCGAAVREFPEPVCVKYGVFNLGTLLVYERLAGISADASEPGPTLIEVPQPGGLLSKPFAECTVEELKRAVMYKRAWPATPIPVEVQERVQLYSRTLARYLTENARLPIRIDTRILRGLIDLRLKALRLADLEQLAEAFPASPQLDRAMFAPKMPPTA
jgi:hypothetical protein